jgi:signal transduction histidine kinase
MKARAQIERELIQAQKLEAIGRLAAGVAHEINTPVQFVADSVHFIRDAAQDLFHVITYYRSLAQAVASCRATPDQARQAATAEEEADLSYLEENVPKALDRVVEGLSRVTALVRSMKEFAHPDRTEQTPTDLNRAILSTLTISRNEYKYVADVETDLAELPDVLCHPGEINQVVLNLVINAAHAIADKVKGTDSRGLIRVTTHQDEGVAVIAIQDTGCGIPEAVRDRIFEPFFTTKEVGRGTGQGLAIARSVVVDKHGGTLRFETELGRGTTFTIRLPIEGRPHLPGPVAATLTQSRQAPSGGSGSALALS